MNQLHRILVSLVVLVSTVFVGTAAAQEVQLVKAVRGFCGGTSGSGGTVCVPHRFLVEVENLSYEKEVFVHYETSYAGQYQWLDAFGYFVESIDADRELWAVEIPTWNSVTEFVIGYETANGAYWDNNSWQNYDMSAGRVLGPEVNVIYHPAENICAACSPGFDLGGNLMPLQGTVLVTNLAPEKVVNIVYSRDGWSTVEATRATWSSAAPNGVETFAFHVDWDEADEIVFAVSYEANNQTMWDNNFGRDYRVARPTSP